jgi:chemotaxis protein CheX
VSTQKLSEIRLNDATASDIIRGVSETISSMAGVKPQPGQYRIEGESEIQGDISGLITVSQDEMEGTLIVSFSHDAIFFILEKVFKRSFDSVDKSVKEAVAEFTNMIYGVIKARMNQEGYRLRMALPTVVMGVKHVVTPLRVDRTMVVPFTIEGKAFEVMLTTLTK